MKKSLLLATILLCCAVAFAQKELLVQSSEKGLYLNHTVAAKENFYSIGRLFNTTPKEIAAFNGLDMNHGLTIGQEVKIPLNAANFSQTAANGRAVYYVVGQKEGLYRVSLKNNNVLMASLRKWNHLANDNISAGQKMIVGYLVSPEAGSIVQTNQEPEKKLPVAEEPKKEVVASPKQEPVVEKKVEEKKLEVKRPAAELEEKRTEQPVLRQATENPAPVTTGADGGYFKPQFALQVKSQPAKTDETASAGIFKTASGWSDAKYYALLDGVEPGTIIKVVNPTNNKTIYAKVLGEMSGIRQNQGYTVRISNAAASALDISETDKFIVRINY